MKRLENKVALITGGSRGMGAAIAERFAAEGADVVITYSKSADSADKVVEKVRQQGRNALAVKADSAVADDLRQAVKQAVAAFGRIDILVNNAGVFQMKMLEDYTLEDYDHMMAVNTKAVFVASQAAVAHMPAGGRIITIGSNMAERLATAGALLYSMSKSALLGLNKGLARDLAGKGITANLVQPGPIDTDMNPADGPHAESIRSHTAIGRYGQAREIASLVTFLASPESSFITGTEQTIDGGYNI
ncbi:3-oxoacyl-[acyl-carrier protein] reductase [Chitinophaga jiangningensis]|uniref:3-oxoacyl-[acyl-carrier protein] reductase n=1 Tax=Chitinophaga jiangningensis TaxID=1419482 RepID=A0A1M6WUL2_9BACT|nr:3-oxoacyl-ACP reductase family protein [Chitinophaga jiangningensis]SHK97346.1 3-oxoacyl-[acyl-carrier protein] reductase [Chitinophaga jiangningensis]